MEHKKEIQYGIQQALAQGKYQYKEVIFKSQEKVEKDLVKKTPGNDIKIKKAKINLRKYVSNK